MMDITQPTEKTCGEKPEFEKLIEEAIAGLNLLRDSLNDKGISDEAKVSVVRGFLLNLGGFDDRV